MSYLDNLLAPDEDATIKANKLRRSITPMHVSIWLFISSADTAWVLFVMDAIFAAMFPSLTGVALIFGIFIYIANLFSHANNKGSRLPIRLPQADVPEKIDYNNDAPGHNGHLKAKGTFFFGNAFKRNAELWGSYVDIATHVLVIGGTGAGKTETLVSMAYNFLANGSGYAYIDPKAAPKLYGQSWYMARMLGRDDDLRTLNFAVGQEDITKGSPSRRSNTLQPFAFGKAEAIKEIPLSLMAGGDDKGGGNAIFAANGKALMTGLMMGLVELRNKGEIYLSVNDVRNYLNPTEYIALATRKDLSPKVAEAMQSYLKSMGWKAGEPRDKWGDFDRQHSFAQNYFLEPLSTMADTYRHIFGVKIGDIHMPDIILQRRIFLTLLPSLEKSKKEATALGRITLAQIRLATAVGLGGGEVMGAWDMIVDSSIMASWVPFGIITDEYAAIAVDGFAEVFTQGRSLGVCGILASQDWAGIKKANEAEAQQIVANTKFKMIMTTDDPNDTKKLIMELSGDVEEMRTQGFQLKNSFNYTDGLSAQAHKTSRVNMLDIAAMVEGEFHLFFKDRLIRGNSFFAGAEPDKNKKSKTPMFVHHLLMIERPSAQLVSSKFGSLKNIIDKWKSGGTKQIYDAESTDCFSHLSSIMATGFAGQPAAEGSFGRMDLAIAAIMGWRDDYVFDAEKWLNHGTARPKQPVVQEFFESHDNLSDLELTAGDPINFDPESDIEIGDTGNAFTGGIEASYDPADAEEEEPVAVSDSTDWAASEGSKSLFKNIMASIAGEDDGDLVAVGVAMGETQEGAEEAVEQLSSIISDTLRNPAYPDDPVPKKDDVGNYRNKLEKWIKKTVT